MVKELLCWLLEIVFGRLLAPCPVIRKSGTLLVVETDWRGLMFSAYASGRKVVVDPMNKVIRFYRRSYWFSIREKFVEFDEIDEIVYGYSDLAGGIWTHRAIDLYSVGIRLRDGSETVLFRFPGGGEFINESIWPDWMYWSDNIMTPLIQGKQGPQSEMLADLLSHMTGAPIGGPS